MVEEHERSCPKLESGEKCKVHKSADDVKIVSYMCPTIASPNQCINPKHSEWDHEHRQCEDPEHSHDAEAKVINFITTYRHAGRHEMDDEDEEHEKSEDEGFEDEIKVGWSYNPVQDVMQLTQRTAQQMRNLQPTMEMRAKRDLGDRDIIKLLLYCDSGSCLNLVSERKARRDGVKIRQGP